MGFLAKVVEGRTHIERLPRGIYDGEVNGYPVVVTPSSLGGCDVDLLRGACHSLIHASLYALRASSVIDEEAIARVLLGERLLCSGERLGEVMVEVGTTELAVHVRSDEIILRSVFELYPNVGSYLLDIYHAIRSHK